MNLNDLTTLSSLSTIVQWAAIILVFCSGVLQIFKHVIDLREKRNSRAWTVAKQQAHDLNILCSPSIIVQWAAIILVFCGGGLQISKQVIDLREKRISHTLVLAKEQAQQQREEELRNKLDLSRKEIQQLSPRTITGSQKQILLNVLRKIGKHSIQIIVANTDTETSQFAFALRAVFDEADWDIEEFGAQFSGPPIVGIRLVVGQNPPPDYLRRIHVTLKNLGFEVQGFIEPGLNGTEKVQIIIGGKPQ